MCSNPLVVGLINNTVLCNILYRSANPCITTSLHHNFFQAKKKINEIFLEVEGYVSEAERFLASVPRYWK